MNQRWSHRKQCCRCCNCALQSSMRPPRHGSNLSLRAPQGKSAAPRHGKGNFLNLKSRCLLVEPTRMTSQCLPEASTVGPKSPQVVVNGGPRQLQQRVVRLRPPIQGGPGGATGCLRGAGAGAGTGAERGGAAAGSGNADGSAPAPSPPTVSPFCGTRPPTVGCRFAHSAHSPSMLMGLVARRRTLRGDRAPSPPWVASP
mmetsp:Transcript_57219/g.185988  ORF Transcript_57219/g.185988 Transcript_57219/m.185988 type:complete len:200 (-) Transcript_57219:225-824(-)